MPALTDPSIALSSFQQAVSSGRLRVEMGRVDPNLRFYLDTDLGVPRFVYYRLDGKMVSAYACFVPGPRVQGAPCFEVGYAAPEAYRGRGLATDVFAAGIAELRNGFAGNPPFWVEAVVGLDNPASQRIASKVLTPDPKQITDQVSGLPALQYLRQFETGQ